jgi:hypothetical protein
VSLIIPFPGRALLLTSGKGYTGGQVTRSWLKIGRSGTRTGLTPEWQVRFWRTRGKTVRRVIPLGSHNVTDDMSFQTSYWQRETTPRQSFRHSRSHLPSFLTPYPPTSGRNQLPPFLPLMSSSRSPPLDLEQITAHVRLKANHPLLPWTLAISASMDQSLVPSASLTTLTIHQAGATAVAMDPHPAILYPPTGQDENARGPPTGGEG